MDSPKKSDPAQYRRFRDLAAELGADGADEKGLERAVQKVGKAPRPPNTAKAKKKG